MTARVSNHDIDQAAADWAARLDRGALTERENAALQVWLNGDSRNQGAFLRAQAIATMSQSAQALGEGFDPGRFTAAGPGGLGPEMSPPSKMKQIGRAHVCTPVTNAHLVCRLLLEKKNKTKEQTIWHRTGATTEEETQA